MEFLSLTENSLLWIEIIFLLWIFWEIVYFLYIRYIVFPKIDPIAEGKPQWFNSSEDLFDYMHDTIDSLDSYIFEDFVTGIFLRAKFDDICLENYHSFLAWALFVRNLNDLTDVQKKMVVLVTEKAECKFNFKFKPGFNPKLYHARLNLEHLSYIHRPMSFVLSVQLFEV